MLFFVGKILFCFRKDVVFAACFKTWAMQFQNFYSHEACQVLRKWFNSKDNSQSRQRIPVLALVRMGNKWLRFQVGCPWGAEALSVMQMLRYVLENKTKRRCSLISLATSLFCRYWWCGKAYARVHKGTLHPFSCVHIFTKSRFWGALPLPLVQFECC